MERSLFSFIVVVILFLIQPFNLFSQYEFIENKGQWHDNVIYKMPLNDGALFLESNCFTYNFIDAEGGRHSSAHHGSEDNYASLIRSAHAYKVIFRGANDNPLISSDKILPDYNNYFIGKDQSKWASKVNKYLMISYQDLYDGIDMLLHAGNNGLKYDFIVHAGGDPKKIDLEYVGTDMLFIENGNLVVSTTVNVVRESKPYAYQIYGTDTVEIACNYVLKRNRLSFEFPNSYDKSKVLVIDPSLVFSTYTGSTGDNWGFTATWDYNDNVYSGGIVFATGYPTSTGAYQINFAGGTAPIPGNPNYYGNGCDVGIIKYNPTGTQRLFATYIGGTGGQEMPHSLVVNEFNELVVMGTTGSPDFPVTAGAFQTTFAGGDSLVYDNVIGFAGGVDIFVSKFNENGTQLLGSTYVGGSANDGLNFKIHYTYPNPTTGINHVKMHGNDSLYFNYGDGARGEVIVDAKNMIYVGTNTFSSDFPSGINPGFQNFSGGGQDGVVFKFNSNLTQMLWRTYLGGSQDDAIFSLGLSENDEVLVAGGTVSHNFPTTSGAYNTTHNGGSTDAFVSKLNMNGNVLMHSTFFGSSVYDNAFFVRTDRYNNVFICGQTRAPGNQLIINAGFSNPNSGQFITKFTPDLSDVVWSTKFGSGNGRPNISITAFAVDVCDRVYLSGWGREWVNNYYNAQGQYYLWTDQFGTKGMPVTPDAIQTTTDGQDFYVLVLNEDASQLEYASFFGEQNYAGCGYSGRDHVDGGTSRFDKKGHIIQSVCASCGGCQQFPTAPNPGVWSPNNNAANCNNAVFKIRIIENLAEANFDPVPVGCAPHTVNFHSTSQGSTFIWNFGDGSPQSSTYNPSHTYTQGGEYTVTLIVGDPLSCNFYDTITRVINVVEPGQSFLPDIIICPGQNTILGPSSSYPAGTSFSWVVGTNLNNNAIQNPVANPSQTTDYLLIATGVCVDSVWQSVIVYEPDIDLFVSNDTMICPGGTVNLNAYTTGTVNSWQWSDNAAFSNILSSSQTLSASPSVNTTYYIRVQENVCNMFVVEQINVSLHQFNYHLTPNHIICPDENINLTLTNQNPTDVLSYNWQPSSQIISGANTNSPLVGPDSETTYTVIITNQMGCTSSAQVTVSIDIVSFASPVLVNNLCYGYCNGTASVSASGISPFSYMWSNLQTGSNISNLCSGTYSVTVTDNNNCTAETSITISEPPQLLASFSNIQHPQCDGVGYGSATISPTGGTAPYNYQWSFGGNMATNNVLLVGNNYVTITDANNCTRVENISMIPPSDLVSSIADYNMISCYGYCDGGISVVANAGNAPYNYNWSNGQFGANIQNLCPGPYTVTVVDVDNCVSHQFLYISQPDSLIALANVSVPIACYGQTGNVNTSVIGGTQPYNYLWSEGTTNSQLTNVGAGTYQVTVVDVNNCIDYANINLVQPDSLVMNTSLENMLCNRVCNGAIFTNINGGTPPYYYSWSNGTNYSNAQSLCAGDYNLIIKDENDCEIQEDFTIVNLGYVPDLEVDANVYEIYVGENVALIAQSSMQGTYTWDNSAVLNNSNIHNPIASPEETTLFMVVFRDENGCTNIDTIRIRVKEVICGNPYIYVPNAFTPNNDGNNDYFKAFFPPTLVTEIYLAVFDRWGNIIYETTQLDAIGWDGTYKGAKLSTDVYVYMLRARCLNGEEFKHDGNVTLLR